MFPRMRLLSLAFLVAIVSTQELPDQWWRETIVYQIYPRSFQDSNGDGIGDLKGECFYSEATLVVIIQFPLINNPKEYTYY